MYSKRKTTRKNSVELEKREIKPTIKVTVFN